MTRQKTVYIGWRNFKFIRSECTTREVKRIAPVFCSRWRYYLTSFKQKDVIWWSLREIPSLETEFYSQSLCATLYNPTSWLPFFVFSSVYVHERINKISALKNFSRHVKKKHRKIFSALIRSHLTDSSSVKLTLILVLCTYFCIIFIQKLFVETSFSGKIWTKKYFNFPNQCASYL